MQEPRELDIAQGEALLRLRDDGRQEVTTMFVQDAMTRSVITVTPHTTTASGCCRPERAPHHVVAGGRSLRPAPRSRR